GELFAEMQRDKFILNKIQCRWYRFAGHSWADDILDTNVQAVEDVALKYQMLADPINAEIAEQRAKQATAEADIDCCKAAGDADSLTEAKHQLDTVKDKISKLLKQRGAFDKRSNQLRTKARAEKCLWWSHHIPNGLAITGDEMDKKPMLLPCLNGVIDLETGKLHDGHPQDYLVNTLPINYDPNATSTDWMPFLREIHQDDEEKAQFVRRFFGYCLTGLTSEQIIACFIGDGANGKGTMFDVMQHILGPLAWSISPELILEQKNPRSSAGASADIMSLNGRRLIIASETAKNRRIAGDAVKRYTGEDILIGRGPFDKVQRHQKQDPQNATIYRQRNDALPRLLKQQAPGILADLVRACLEWQRDGLNPPESINIAAEQHHLEEDHLARFCREACTLEEGYRITVGNFHKIYIKWYGTEISSKDRFAPSTIAVGKDLVKLGYRKESQGGNTWVFGLRPPEYNSLDY
ncbi:MAG: hypothetical protein JRG71_14560, partial [Deltaproteobacteria bacterium]|nr:hypothetical protein [Deltaproteobacteria bacterium]